MLRDQPTQPRTALLEDGQHIRDPEVRALSVAEEQGKGRRQGIAGAEDLVSLAAQLNEGLERIFRDGDARGPPPHIVKSTKLGVLVLVLALDRGREV